MRDSSTARKYDPSLTNYTISEMEALKERIKARADAFNMSLWVGMKDLCDGDTVPEPTPCNTVCCLAGDVLIHHGYKMACRSVGSPVLFVDRENRAIEVCDEAARMLQISHTQASSLFYTNQWPTPFRYAYGRAESNRERANIACDRINHFLKNGY